MSHGKIIGLSAGVLTLAVCAGALSYGRGSEPQVRGAVAGHRTPQSAKETPKASTFATDREPSELPHTAIQRTSVDVSKTPERPLKSLLPKPEAERSTKEHNAPAVGSESVLTALARELGVTSLREAAQRKGKRQVGKVFENILSDGKRRPQTTTPPAVASPKPAPATPSVSTNALMERIHRDATSLPSTVKSKKAESTDEESTANATVTPSVSPEPVPTRLLDPPSALFSPSNTKVPDLPTTHSNSRNSTHVLANTGRFAHSEDYSSLTGEVQLWRNTWRLRYARVDETDKYGGSVILAGESRFSDLRDGQIIRVRGRIIQADSRNGAVFEVESVDVLEK